MDKKIKFLFATILIIAAIPFAYKQYLQKTILARINSLQEKGFSIQKIEDKSSYLSTMQSYKVILSDPKAFYEKSLATFFNPSQKKLMLQLLDSFTGSELSIDLNILNFPVTHKNAVGIYFTALPPKVSASARDSKEMLKQIDSFLSKKGFGEIIDIDALGKVKYIRLKDIDELFSENGEKVGIKIKDYVIKVSKFDIKNYNYSLLTTNPLFEVTIEPKNSLDIKAGYKELKCNNDRENFYNTQGACSVKNFYFDIASKQETLKTSFNNIALFAKSFLKANDLYYSFRYKIADIDIKQSKYAKNSSIKIDDLVYEGELEGIKKETIEKFSKIRYNQNQIAMQKEYRKLFQEVLNNGFIFKINTLKLAHIDIQSNLQNISLGPIKTNLTLTLLKNNLSLQQRVNPLMLLSYLTVDSKIVLTKQDYGYFSKMLGSRVMHKISKLAKQQGDSVIFDISFSNGKLYINGTKM